MNNQLTPEQLATELLTTNQSMKNGAPDARRLLAELQRHWLHQAARLMENAGYDDDAINWLDAYADYDPAGDMAGVADQMGQLFERLGPPTRPVKPDAIEYGIRLTPDAPDSEVHGYQRHRRIDVEDRLKQNRTLHPDAQLVQRTVHRSQWTDATTT
ncbi:hypothetical protein [Streptomyces sp. NBC_01422]|uniref:hypothetical protein n=1 Tax=Streptomyces sp. NBC_01422 TaxID=2903859 RepID=UPI002E29BE72|nr:hypothetical protein [Streptomyces sp. NBC_01422]